MVSHHGRVACKAIPSRPATVFGASYGVNGQLESSVLSVGNKTYRTLDLPEEGIYIAYQDRALQIAAPPCDQRKCIISHICNCDAHQLSTRSRFPGRHGLKRKALSWPTWKPCKECLFHWLRLYQAVEAGHKLGMKFLQHPRALTRVTINDHQAFYYDDELEEALVCSNDNGTIVRSTSTKSCCPQRLFEWMTDSWSDFTKIGCHKRGSITTLPDLGDEYPSKNCLGNKIEDPDNDSEWDDLDIPCTPSNQSGHGGPEDYDLIDDIIEEEFPKLQKSGSPKTCAIASATPKAEPSPQIPDDDSCDEDDSPVPVIIPPKNMMIARDFRCSTELALPIPTQSGTRHSTSHDDSQCQKPQPALGTKRSYRDLVGQEQYNSVSTEDLLRAKQRKREPVHPRVRSTHYQSTTDRKWTSISQLDHVPPKLILT
ncbi:hypothetical protein GGR54DRAFT_53904 [Hypoxylon sp. NC1633]|nr:hypothetical protein GGR54DRAFT_53904 [Hypoxylon sp. NC1633]